MSSYILEARLAHIRPRIWRQLQVPGDLSLSAFHSALQIAFGWDDCHLHEFVVGEVRYGVPDPDAESEVTDEADVTVALALPYKSSTMKYVYDFGDDWIHNISVDRIETSPAPRGTHRLRARTHAAPLACLAGKRAGPPEDCGGPHGYAELLQALDDPAHPRHKELMEWVGSAFDPAAISLGEINRGLSALV